MIVKMQSLVGIVGIYIFWSLIYDPSVGFIPLTAPGTYIARLKLHLKGINEKSQAINIYNAHQIALLLYCRLTQDSGR